MARIVLEVPDTCKSLLTVIPAVVACLTGIATDTAASEDVDYVAVERDVAAQCARLECAAHRDTRTPDPRPPYRLIPAVSAPPGS